MKSTIEILLELPEKQFKEAVTECIKQNGIGSLTDAPSLPLKQLLSQLFIWGKTKQGQEYWETIQNDL